MPRGKKFTAEQIIGKLREAEVGLAQGKTVPEVVRKLGVTDQPLSQRHAEMASAAVGPPLVECEDDRAVGHVSHMPHRPVVERVDFHCDTPKVFDVLDHAGLARPIICTPEELLNDDTEIS
jgi:hypothetical protein